MKYILLSLFVALSVSAQNGPKPEHKGPPPGDRPQRPHLTEEQKKQRDALIAKYDTNKDGKLDKEERLKVSEEDRKNLRSFGPPGGPRGPRKDGPPPKRD